MLSIQQFLFSITIQIWTLPFVVKWVSSGYLFLIGYIFNCSFSVFGFYYKQLTGLIMRLQKNK